MTFENQLALADEQLKDDTLKKIQLTNDLKQYEDYLKDL